MPGESIRDYSAWRDLEANGAAVANNAFGEANDAQFNLTTHGGDRPHLQFELDFIFGTAPTAGTVLALHHQDHDFFGGATDARAPSANNLRGFLRSVLVENVTVQQLYRFDVMFAPTHAAYWLQNVGTGQSVSAAWRLRARAWGMKAA